MGSEMCIRDRKKGGAVPVGAGGIRKPTKPDVGDQGIHSSVAGCCLLYTSDAADERSSVDLGGRRIIKKKKNRH